MKVDYDIVIAGGGMVGASLACALGSLPLSVAVIEAVEFGVKSQPSFDDRTLALSRSSQRILSGIGAWARLENEATPIRRIHVSERGRFGTALIDASEQGIDALGFVVASRELGAALWERMGSLPNVEVIAPAKLSSPRCDGERMHSTLERDDRSAGLSAKLLVVADGAASPLRTALKIKASSRDYGQTAVIGNVEVSRPGDGATAYERFSAEGPLALLPAGGHRFVFVLSRMAASAPQTLELDDQQFLALLQDTFGRRLGEFRRVGRRGGYPLSLVQAEQVIAPRAVVVGNAAHGLHPVAGQGYNLSLRDVAALAELIADAGDRDPGCESLLRSYADWRYRDQRNVVAFTDGLIRLFELPGSAAGFARGFSLMAFDALPEVKRELARHTMGLAGRQSRLARGLPL